MKPRTGIIGRPADGIEDDDFMVCPACGVRFDMRKLDDALDHWHDGTEVQMAPELENNQN